MDRLEAMSIVLAVAETGSLSAAARRLNAPVAATSRKITELEAHLRVKPFDRSSGKLMLTDTGGLQEFLPLTGLALIHACAYLVVAP